MENHLKSKSKNFNIYRLKSTLNKAKKQQQNLLEISDVHYLSYMRNLEVISREFVISVQQRKNEKIMKLLGMQALILIYGV